MKHKKLSDALQELQDNHIAEAASYKKRRPIRWVAPIAAVLALTILLGTFYRPPNTPGKDPTQSPTLPVPPAAPLLQGVDPSSLPTENADQGIQLQYLVAGAQHPQMAVFPEIGGDGDHEAWYADQKAMHTQPQGYADSLQSFWPALTRTLSENADRNVTFSPVNIYMALAMLAEITDGNSRQQILNTLGVDSIYQLRIQAGHVWRGHYNNDGLSTSILANSLWLEEGYGFNPETAQRLADTYYASVFQGDLGTLAMNAALLAWLDDHTGGLLTEQIRDTTIDPQTVLMLASTVFYQVQWLDAFDDRQNTKGTFHALSGDTEETFMNRTLTYGPYYWSDRFGAVSIPLEDGSQMWLILPDDGVTPADIAGDVAQFLNQDAYAYENQKNMIVNLSVPKFDITADMDLVKALQSMGITDIFQADTANFTPILPKDDGGFISNIQHATRVAIDEKGVTAAAFTLILRAGAAPPPEEEIDFVLDRPFLFCIESQDGLPLFTGIVNNP